MDDDESGHGTVVDAGPDRGPAEGGGGAPAGAARRAPTPLAAGSEVPARPDRSGHGPAADLVLRLGGPLLVLVVVLVALVVALALALVGSRQPDVVTLRDSGTVDTFDRPNGDFIGAPPLLGPWQTTGEWRLVDGTAYLAAAPPEGGPGYALLPGEVGDGRIAATVLGIAGEGGIVARYAGPGDHVTLRPLAGQAAWELVVVADGEQVAAQSLGLVGTPEGSRIELVLEGATAWAIINGQLRGEPMDISAAPSSGGVGLVASLDDEGGSSRFDDVARERP